MLSREDNEYLTRTGPGAPMGNFMRRFWMPFMLSDEIAEPDCPPVRVTLLGEDLLAFRDSKGRAALVDQFCPHRRVSLFFGRNEDCGIRCVYHGWKFDADGNCVDMPSEPADSTYKDKVKLKSYPVREKAGIVWAYMGPVDKQSDLPELEWMNVPDDHLYVSRWIQQCNFVQAVEGEIDSAHVSFLHRKLENDAQNKAALTGAFFANDTAPKWKVTESDFGMTLGARRKVENGRFYWRMNQWLYPFYTMIAPVPGEARTVRMWVPVDDGRCNIICISYRNDKPLSEQELHNWQTGAAGHAARIPGTLTPIANLDNDYNIDRELQAAESFTGITGIRAQDAAMTESPGRIVDRSQEHLATSDTAIIQMRKLLIDGARNLEKGIEPAAAQDGAIYRVRSHSVVIDEEIDFDDRADILEDMRVTAGVGTQAAE
ncbi:MAG: Rieske 2Fe-2S domain-containing protein [Alphaproteobacteria bacterium]|nr:Rieske 2Fe-2S domain-containing protein [Alphaproteobacteria bacterium]